MVVILLLMMVLYMHRGARIVLPEAVAVEQDGDDTRFIDQAGHLVALMHAEDVWVYADHDLIDDVDTDD